jgi:hypothetical protein
MSQAAWECWTADGSGKSSKSSSSCTAVMYIQQMFHLHQNISNLLTYLRHALRTDQLRSYRIFVCVIVDKSVLFENAREEGIGVERSSKYAIIEGSLGIVDEKN